MPWPHRDHPASAAAGAARLAAPTRASDFYCRWLIAWALTWAASNLFLLLAALRGWLKQRLGVYGIVLIGFIVVRSAFLGTIGNPEPRYVLECFPVIIALAGGGLVLRGREYRT